MAKGDADVSKARSAKGRGPCRPCGSDAAGDLRPLVLERLARYHICLHRRDRADEPAVFSSGQVARCVGVDDTQVRKDFALIGVRGRPHVGFRRDEAIRSIHRHLGLDRTYRAAIIGAGRLGGALAEYPGFRDYGLNTVAVFDSDPETIGTQVGGLVVRPMSDLSSVVRRKAVELAVLTCPAHAAQEVAECLVKAGVRALWNFAPTQLLLGPETVVRNEHIFTGLAELTHHLTRQAERGQ